MICCFLIVKQYFLQLLGGKIYFIYVYLLLCGILGKNEDYGHWRQLFVADIFLDGCVEEGPMSGESKLLIIMK